VESPRERRNREIEAEREAYEAEREAAGEEEKKVLARRAELEPDRASPKGDGRPFEPTDPRRQRKPPGFENRPDVERA